MRIVVAIVAGVVAPLAFVGVCIACNALSVLLSPTFGEEGAKIVSLIAALLVFLAPPMVFTYPGWDS